MKTILIIALVLISSSIVNAQEIEKQNVADPLTVVFDAGLLIGHSDTHYPTPFSSNISLLANYNNRIWYGGGGGAMVIGKTFIPLFFDLRLIPFKSKPLFLYNKLGYTFCVNKNYSDGSNDFGYYNNYPHPVNDKVETKGGIMNESGLGVILQHNEWATSFSIGYAYFQTQDLYTDTHERTYEYVFNRLAFRVGFWF